jgi:hypothetical protein
MKIHWRTLSSRAYAALAPDGSPLELHAGAGGDDDDGWHLFSSMPEHAGVDYLGDDLHSAMYLTIAMMRGTHKVEGWTVDGREDGNLVWGTTAPPDATDENDPTDTSWWRRFLRRSEPAE